MLVIVMTSLVSLISLVSLENLLFFFPLCYYEGANMFAAPTPGDHIMEGWSNSPFESPPSWGRGLFLEWTAPTSGSSLHLCVLLETANPCR